MPEMQLDRIKSGCERDTCGGGELTDDPPISATVISRQYPSEVGLIKRLGATGVTPVSFFDATTPA